MSLRELYQEIIIDHGKTPRNHGVLPDATYTQIGHNPLCGDQLTLYVLEQADKIISVRFEGTGCAISIASASLMTESITGKSQAEIKQLFSHFHQLVTEGCLPDIEIGKLTVFAGVAEFPVRVKCATLAWHTLIAAFTQEKKIVSTE